MTNWLGLLYAMVKVVLWLIDQYEERKILKQAEAQALKRSMEAANAEIKRALEARKRADDNINAAGPDNLRDDDGFRRD